MSFAGGRLKLKGGLSIKSGGTKKKKKSKTRISETDIVPVNDSSTEIQDGEESKQQEQLQLTEDEEKDASLEVGGTAEPMESRPGSLKPGDEPIETPEGFHLPPRAENEDRRTEMEKKYDEWQRRQEQHQVKQLATKSHRERVREFNEYLANLTEHHDIPKVGPG